MCNHSTSSITPFVPYKLCKTIGTMKPGTMKVNVSQSIRTTTATLKTAQKTIRSSSMSSINKAMSLSNIQSDQLQSPIFVTAAKPQVPSLFGSSNQSTDIRQLNVPALITTEEVKEFPFSVFAKQNYQEQTTGMSPCFFITTFTAHPTYMSNRNPPLHTYTRAHSNALLQSLYSTTIIHKIHRKTEETRCDTEWIDVLL